MPDSGLRKAPITRRRFAFPTVRGPVWGSWVSFDLPLALNNDCCNCSLDPKQPGSQAPLPVPFDEVCEGIDLGAKPRMTRQGAFSST